MHRRLRAAIMGAAGSTRPSGPGNATGVRHHQPNGRHVQHRDSPQFGPQLRMSSKSEGFLFLPQSFSASHVRRRVHRYSIHTRIHALAEPMVIAYMYAWLALFGLNRRQQNSPMCRSPLEDLYDRYQKEARFCAHAMSGPHTGIACHRVLAPMRIGLVECRMSQDQDTWTSTEKTSMHLQCFCTLSYIQSVDVTCK